MKSLLCSLLAAAIPLMAGAQTEKKPAPPRKAQAVKTSAKPAARPAARVEAPAQTIKLSEAEFETAKQVFTGDIKCELGALVNVQAHQQREGFFNVTLKGHHFVMHPVESRTGAIRLEDPSQGAVWLQLANKSMLMSQKLGQRLADECQSSAQAAFAESMKSKPQPDLLQGTPAGATSTR